jgi:hypothetical protein
MDSDAVLTAIAALQEEQQLQTGVLQHLEARPVVDLDGVGRRLDELADAVDRAQQTLATRLRQRRAWWRTPAYVTLAFVGGVLLCYGVLVWVSHQQRAASHQGVPASPPPVTASPLPGKKGK